LVLAWCWLGVGLVFGLVLHEPKPGADRLNI
jgi:hypothetical protein